MRCFIALDLPEEARKNLAEAQQLLRQDFPDARWTRPDGLHITLAFLGDISSPALECAREAVRAAAGLGSFELGFSGLVCLPARGNPRVLALKAGSGARECGLAHERVNRALARAAEERGLGALNSEWPDGRPFLVHITLARSGRGSLPRRAESAWERIAPQAQASCRISRCILYRSELCPDGARYVPLCSAEL